MKFIKTIAFICVVALLCSVFSVVPINAFSNTEYESDTWNIKNFQSNSSLVGWRSAPTVLGFDDYLNFYPPYYVVTHKNYDLSNTKILLNSVEISSGYWASVTFSSEGINGESKNSDPINGILCLLLETDDYGNLIITRYQNNVKNTLFTVEAAETYEFEFIKKTSVTYSSSSPTYTHYYIIRVNEKYYQTNSSASWLYQFMNSKSFSKSYINLGAQSRLKANVKVLEKGYFSTANTNALYYDGSVDNRGYQQICAKESAYALATSTKHNMFEEALELKDINLDTSSSVKLNFSSLYRYDSTSLFASEKNLGLVIKKEASNKITVCVVGASGGETLLTSFSLKNPLEIMFIDDGAGGYGLLVGGYYFENSNISKFLAAGSAKECYISVSASGTFESNVKFKDKSLPEWVTDAWKSAITTSTTDDGQTIYTAPWQTTLTTAKKIDALNNIFILENAYFGTEQRAFILSFSTSHIGASRDDTATEGRLIFDVYTQNDKDGNCTGLRVHRSSGSQIGAIVPPADSYYISLCEIDGVYYLKINDSLFTTDLITNFCKKFANGVYVTISPYNSTMKYSLDIWDLGPGFTLNSDEYSVDIKQVGAVKPFSSANELINKLEVTDGYELKVSTAQGDDRTFADILATDDKLVVTYKDRDVASFDIAVGGDLTGDAKVLSDDIVLLRKQLLGVGALSGIYSTALDVNCDGDFNILDFIKIQKVVVENENRLSDLLGLVDFAVEVESGREPIILQLTDTLVLDSAQVRKDGILSDYQTEFWSADMADDNCYTYITETVNATKPDLIIISGNLVYGEFDDNGTAFKSFVDYMESLGIPWAPVFGEHDNESVKGVDWQCDILESAENCLFKQRNLTGNGNYTVGIIQNNKLLRVFYMLDSSGCKNASKASLNNNHTKTTAGFGKDQIVWYERLIGKTQKISPDTKISFVYGIQQSAFGDALAKYGFTENFTRETPINLNKTSCQAGDFGYIGANLNNAWDTDNTVINGMKKLGVDSVFSGGEAANSASVLYDGVRFQYGQKSSTYGYYNNVLNDGTVKALYPEDNGYTPLIGGTVIPISYSDGSIKEPYIYYCDKAGGDINFAKAVTLYVKDFGAVGDGVTDDGNAIYNALEAFMKCGSGSKLVFENKTYYIEDNSDRHNRALCFKNMYNSSVEGNGATILIGGETVYMTVSNCKDFEINGLKFDRKIRSHFVGTVQNYFPSLSGYIEIKADRDFGFTDDVFAPSKQIFAFALSDGVVKRNYIYMDKLETVDAEKGIYRFYPDTTDTLLNTMGNFKKLTKGSKVVIPTPYIGHYMDDDFLITGNTNLTLKDIDVYNGADFVFNVSSNPGNITFDNVNITPPEEETTNFVTWRDGFHCKYNRGSLIWRNCKAVGLGDDIINISCYMMHVGEVIADNEVICDWDLTGGSYGYAVPVGAEVEIYDVDTGKLIGETTIKSVVSHTDNHYILADSLSGLTAGENIRFNVISDAAPNSLVTGCDFEGTLRFKGAGGVVENSRLSLYAMMMYPETTLEGPIPRDTTFRNCDFTGTWTGRIDVSCLSPVTTWQEGYYRLKNIRFENCTGLTKSLFNSAHNNFDKNSVNYITVTPAIS